MDLDFEKYQYLDEVYEKAIKWLNKQGQWRGAAMKNISIAMNIFNERSIDITKNDILKAEARREFHHKNRIRDDILNMGQNKYPDIKRGDNFEYDGDYYVFDRYGEDGSHIFKDSLGRDKHVQGGPTDLFNKLDPSQNMIDIDFMDEYTKSSYDLFSAKQYYEELLETRGQEAADEFFQEVINPLSEQVKNARMKLDAGLNKKHGSGSYTEDVRNLIDWEREIHGQMVTQGRWKKNTSNTSTSSSNAPDINLDNSQSTVPQRGDQFYDPKRKRQYVYEGPDETFEGMHSFISDQGRTFVGSLDDLEKFTDESKFLNIDDLTEYRNAIDDLDVFLKDIRHGSKSMEDGFWDRAQKAVRRVNKAEGKVKKKIKYHRMENDAYKTKKVLQGYINDWKNKQTQQSAPQPESKQKENISETDVSFEEEWFDGYDGADNIPFDAEDFDDEFLANLTDDQILNQARNNEELERYIKMRDDARTRLGMDNQTFNIETENRTINNNFNGVNQQQTKNTTEETIEEKIERLTEEEKQRFERESQTDFDKSMKEIETKFNQEAERIENEFGPAKYDLDDTSLHLDTPDVKTRKQRLENAGKRLSNNKGPNGTKKRFTGQRVANNSKRSIKKRKLSGKKFKIKGGNFKQAAANTFVNIATDTVRETISKNADELKNFGRHPNMFEFDEFADLTDADIDFYYDNLFGMDVKTKQQMRKSWIEKRKLAKTARESARKHKIIDNFDDYMDNFFSYTGYSSVEGQARFNPDPRVGWDEIDFKNPDSYNKHKIDFEVDDDGNLKFKRYDEMETVEIEQNKPRRVKGNVADDDIFGWMKKHKLGLGEAINVLSTVSTYKDARKQGHSVGSSIVRAAGSFVMGEMLGFWGSMGWELAKGIPKAAIKGAEVLYKENRKMNAAANQYGLGGDFHDTQQLATMRQSGLNY